MKKLRDIFELPVTGVDVQGKDVYYAQPENDKLADDAIAHAINHVDALADALDKLLDEVAGDSIHNYLSEETCKAHDAGIAALNAYRGEK